MANCGPTGTESPGDGDSWWGSTPHPADSSDDIFLHGPGYTDVALPIWTTPDAALVTYRPRLILPIRQALMAADPADVSSILKGLVSQAGSRTVLVTGWVPRTGRVRPGDSAKDCVGLAGCFTVSTTSFKSSKPAAAPAPESFGDYFAGAKGRIAYTNAPLTAKAVGWMQDAGGQCMPANEDFIIICFNTPTWGNAGAITIGNAIAVAPEADWTADIYVHEKHHVAQWADTPDFGSDYIEASLRSHYHTGHYACWNPFELDAGLVEGGYADDCRG